jgi:hypothetical protein
MQFSAGERLWRHGYTLLLSPADCGFGADGRCQRGRHNPILTEEIGIYATASRLGKAIRTEQQNVVLPQQSSRCILFALPIGDHPSGQTIRRASIPPDCHGL